MSEIKRGTTTVIHVAQEEILRRKKLFEDSRTPTGGGRWPVLVDWTLDSYMAEFGIDESVMKDPSRHVETQIAYRKWVFENMETDLYEFVIAPRGGGGTLAECFGLKRLPKGMYTPLDGFDIDAIRNIKMREQKAYEDDLKAFGVYSELAQEYAVQFLGGDVFYPLANPSLPYVKFVAGPLSCAVDLFGPEAVFLKMYDDPPFLKELLEVIAEKYIEVSSENRKVSGNNDLVFVLEDSSPMITADQYREFCLLPLQRYKHALGRILIHNCITPVHIVDIMVNEIAPEVINGFKGRHGESFVSEMQIMADRAGGRTYLEPYLDGTVLLHQTEEQIYRDACDIMQIFGPKGSFHLGAFACGGTPINAVKKMNAIRRASIATGSAC